MSKLRAIVSVIALSAVFDLAIFVMLDMEDHHLTRAWRAVVCLTSLIIAYLMVGRGDKNE